MIHCDNCGEVDHNAEKKIENWANRIEKATMNVSSHLFREVLEVLKEMKEEI